MPQQIINIGAAPDDGTGDTLRSGGDKINDNFTELYGEDVALDGRVTALEGAGAGTLDGLTDVNAPTPSNGDVLTWDDTPGEWVSAAPTGGANALDDLTDVAAPTPSDGDVLTFDSGSGDWVSAAPSGGGTPSGTSFPGSPATDDLFYRTDRRIEYFYDGTRWLSTFPVILNIDSRGDQTATSFGQMIVGLPYSGTYGFYVENINVISVLTNATTASNYFTYNFYHVTTSAGTLLGSYSSISDTQNQFQQNSVSVGVELASTVKEIHLDMVETGTASGRANSQIIGRLVG